MDQLPPSPSVEALRNAGWMVQDDSRGFVRFVGPLWEHASGQLITYGFLADERHVNVRGVVHGGMMLTFVDQALGLTVRQHTGGLPQATIQLDTHFVSAVSVGEFVQARAEVVKRTRSLVFINGTMFVGDRVVATSHGIWKLPNSNFKS
jgi:uncharacterized protein (TIGR00369 family)